ncbi:hypothetical protein [Sphingomonas hankyongi]|uniref:Uncharacterized protein n=1 Tax=Sphingomonas hankyongi TaxID=2908209 RepID=A0ABT0RYB4_9SPHN|nr:hypothetical protein [Sphingomonas hankyongi]MCL6728598.1 hypothetical protein [Sphingomonas hankyongi]
MSWAHAERVELGVDSLAASALALAGGFAATLLGPAYVAAAAGAAAGLTGYAALRAVQPKPATFRLPHFAPTAFEACEVEELLLTEEDRLRPGHAGSDDVVLLLDDILAELGPDSRVVRLFDPSSMPSPGELQNRIDRHLDRASQSAPPDTSEALYDASQALYDALAELRRSLK